MNSLKVPETGLRLEGPSEEDSSSPPQAFVLSLSDAVVHKLIQSARNGEDLHLALGNTPVRWLLGNLLPPCFGQAMTRTCICHWMKHYRATALCLALFYIRWTC